MTRIYRSIVCDMPRIFAARVLLHSRGIYRGNIIVTFHTQGRLKRERLHFVEIHRLNTQFHLAGALSASRRLTPGGIT